MSLGPGDPESIGDYALLDRLGSGGMGVVYLGRSASGRQVAVKVVHAQYAQDEEFRTRFRQEVVAARRVSGAFTAPVVDADPDATTPWMATLYVPGRTLSETVAKDGPLAGRDLRTLGVGLVEALRDIHKAGLVHRDLKPGNVLMAEDGPRVIDFGISRAADNQALTVTGRLMGTPPFMSPEQFSSPRDVTAASDVFSLGSVLVYAATGAGPFDADSPYMTGYQVMYEPAVLDGVGEPLLSIVKRCLDKDPAARAGLTELHHMLRALPDSGEAVTLVEAAGLPPRTLPGPPADAPTQAPAQGTQVATGPLTGRIRRGRRVLVSVAATLAVTGLSITTVHFVSRSDTTPQSPTASATATGPRAAALPAGWKPWRTELAADSGDIDPVSWAEAGCVSGGNALYCAGTGFTVAKVDAATGRVLWRSGTNPQEIRPVGVQDGLVYVYRLPDDAADGNRVMQLVALDALTGKERWAHRIGDNDAPAYLFGGGVLTMTPSGTQFVAYAPSGKELWTRSASMPGGKSCEPLVLGDAPYGLCSSDDDPNGVPMNLLRLGESDGARSDLATLPPTAQPLGVAGKQFLFAVTQDPDKVSQSEGDWSYTALVRVNPSSGAVQRVPLTGSPRGAAALVDGAVYVVRNDGVVVAESATTGKQLWRKATELEDMSVPVASSTYGDLYFANHFGRLLALDRDTGAERWRTAAMDGLEDSDDFTPSVLLVQDAIMGVAGDTVFSVRPDRPTDRPTARSSAATAG